MAHGIGRVNRKLFLFWACVVGMLYAMVPAAYAGPIPEEARKADARLEEKRVSTFSSRIYVGDLLKQWSEQTGVIVTADERSGAASQPVCVFVRDIPLGDAMDALYSLLSYRGAAWDWKSRRAGEGEGGAFTYEFTQTREARGFAQQVQQEVQEDFEAAAAKSGKILAMTPEERKEAGKKDEYLALMGGDKRVLAGLETFFQTLQPKTRLRILRGEETVLMPVSQLPDAGKKFVGAELKLARDTNQGQEIADYTHIRFERKQFQEKISPSLMILMGDEKGQGGYGYIGGTLFEKGWRKNLTDRWLLDGDERENAQAPLGEKVAPPKASPAAPAPPRPSARGELTRRLHELAAGMPQIPLMARLSSEQNAPEAPHTFPSAAAFLQRLGDYSVPHKWRNGVLLLTHSTWFRQNGSDSLPAWAAISRLRDALANNDDGIASVADLAFVAKESSPGQLEQLAEDFPGIRGMTPYQDLFRLLGQSRTLLEGALSPEGIAMDRIPAAVLEGKLTLPAKFAPPPRVRARLSVSEKYHSDAFPPSRRVFLEALSGDGKWVEASIGFRVTGRAQENPRAAVSSR